jgi:hypothetical protein
MVVILLLAKKFKRKVNKIIAGPKLMRMSEFREDILKRREWYV